MLFEIETAVNEKMVKLIYDNKFNYFMTLDGRKINFSFSNIPKKYFHVRISLGMACNMRCVYCSEKHNRTELIPTPSSFSASQFANSLKKYLRTKCENIPEMSFSFWGGEPLLYFPIIIELKKALSDIFNCSRFGLSTNGLLLKGPIFDYILDNEIGCGISYDGPGQYMRQSSEDIFKVGTEQWENIRNQLLVKNDIFSFNPVIHKGNPNFSNWEKFMQERLECENIPVGDAPYMRLYDDDHLQFLLSDLELGKDVVDRINRINNDEVMPQAFTKKLLRVLQDTGKEEPSFPCITTNKKNYLAVDLNGNVWGCHNNVGQYKEKTGGNLYGGNIFKNKHINIPYVTLTTRRNTTCQTCLLRYFCGGGCAVIEDKYADKNCNIAWYSAFPLLYAVVRTITNGGKLISVSRI